MKDWGIETYIAVVMFAAGIISFFWKSAKKVENTDINLGHEVEKNKAELVRLAAQFAEDKVRLSAQIAEDKSNFDARLKNVESIMINKAVTDAVLAQNVEHISKSIDEIKQTQNDVLSKTLSFLHFFQQNAQKGGSL